MRRRMVLVLSLLAACDPLSPAVDSGLGGGSGGSSGGGAAGGGSGSGGGGGSRMCSNGMEPGTGVCEFGGNTLVACDDRNGALIALRKVCGGAFPSCAAESYDGIHYYAACCPDGNLGHPRDASCSH
jgi:hypothetical protein